MSVESFGVYSFTLGRCLLVDLSINSLIGFGREGPASLGATLGVVLAAVEGLRLGWPSSVAGRATVVVVVVVVDGVSLFLELSADSPGRNARFASETRRGVAVSGNLERFGAVDDFVGFDWGFAEPPVALL